MFVALGPIRSHQPLGCINHFTLAERNDSRQRCCVGLITDGMVSRRVIGFTPCGLARRTLSQGLIMENCARILFGGRLRPPEFFIRKRAYMAECAAAARAFIRALKSETPCGDCGGLFPHFVMEFDHRDPAQKSFNISSRMSSGMSLMRLKKEIEKCDLLCANCHSTRTYFRSLGGQKP